MTRRTSTQSLQAVFDEAERLLGRDLVGHEQEII